jgi:hypothetical protein
VTDGDRKRVGSISLRYARQIEHDAHHVLDLFLIGSARADDGPFDLTRRILGNRKIRGNSRSDRNTAGLPELERGARVPRNEHVLNGQLIGTVAFDELDDPVIDDTEALGELLA